jgi:hypothetical protein
MKDKYIKLFFKTYGKNYNDKHNKIRENILLFLSTHKEQELIQFKSKYYLKWKLIYNKWNESIKSLCNFNFTNFKIEKKGGRSVNYDFVVNYYLENKIVQTKYLEFKYNCSVLEKLPEFLQVSTKNFMLNDIENSYEYYFYNNYLNKVINDVYKRFNINIIDINEYCKYIYQDKYEKHIFFNDMYKYEKQLNDEEIRLRDNYINESIKNYLEIFHTKLNIKKFLDKVISTQNNKVFIMWYRDEFKIYDSLLANEASLDINKYNITIDKNNVYVSNGNITFKLLLRWKNHKGILNPAWQISFKNNK